MLFVKQNFRKMCGENNIKQNNGESPDKGEKII